MSKLTDKRDKLYKELEEVYKQIDAEQHDSTIEHLKQFVGKYYIEIHDDKHHEGKYNYVYAYFIYKIETQSANIDLCTLEVNYYPNIPSGHCRIDDSTFFSPEKDNESCLGNKITEITKEEFLEHYRIVQKRILNEIGKIV